MDHGSLVAARVRDGRALVSELVRERIIDVTVALWSKKAGIGYWSFYIGSDYLSSMNTGEYFRPISLALDRLDRPAIGLSEIKVVAPTDPIAADAIVFRDQQPGDLPAIVRGCQLGDLEIEEAFIYPKTLGTQSRQDVVQRVAALLSREGNPGSTSITLKDGRSIRAVPTGIRRDDPGGVRIVLHDTASDADLTISADEIFTIH